MDILNQINERKSHHYGLNFFLCDVRGAGGVEERGMREGIDSLYPDIQLSYRVYGLVGTRATVSRMSFLYSLFSVVYASTCSPPPPVL